MSEPGDVEYSEKNYGNEGKPELKSLVSAMIQTGDTLMNYLISQ